MNDLQRLKVAQVPDLRVIPLERTPVPMILKVSAPAPPKPLALKASVWAGRRLIRRGGCSLPQSAGRLFFRLSHAGRIDPTSHDTHKAILHSKFKNLSSNSANSTRT